MRLVLALLALIVVAGGALRFDAARTPSDYQSKDERSYAMLARAIVKYKAYEHPGMKDEMHWPPGGPILFALSHRAFPDIRGDGVFDVPGAYRVQAAVGTASIVTTFLLAYLLAGPVAGLLAAALMAFYPPLINATGDLLTEPLGALLATGGLAALVWAVQGGLPWRRLALSGVLLSATVLTRADLALLPAIALLVVLVVAWQRTRGERRPRLRQTARAALPLLGGLAALLVPWTAYASIESGRPVVLSSGGESNLFVGTYLPGKGTMFGVKKALADETRQRFPHLQELDWYDLRQRDVMRAVALRRPWLTESEALSAAGRENLRKYALGDPIDFAGMMASKTWRLWGAYSVGTHGNRRAPVLWYHRFIVAFGLIGMVAGLAYARRHLLWIVALPLLYVTVLNAVLVSEARHNLTVMPLVAVMGATGVVLAWRHRRERAGAPAERREEEVQAWPARA